MTNNKENAGFLTPLNNCEKVKVAERLIKTESAESEVFKEIFSPELTLPHVDDSLTKKEFKTEHIEEENSDSKLLAKWNITKNILVRLKTHDIEDSSNEKIRAKWKINKNLQVRLVKLDYDDLYKSSTKLEAEKNFSYNEKVKPLSSSSKNSQFKKKDYYCSDCEYSSKNERNFKLHNRKYHTNETKKKFSCKFCKKPFLTDLLVKWHYRKSCSFRSSIKICEYCNDWFLISEMKTHGRDSPIKKCPDTSCKKLYYCPVLFRYHEKYHKRLHSCNFCDKKFTSSGNLKQHVDRVHKKIERFHCDVCDKGFYFRRALKIHLTRLHFVRKTISRYRCDVCGKGYYVLKDLKRHITQVHFVSDVKQFSCSVCKKGFFTKFQYKSHIAQHVTSKFPCPKCTRTYKNKNSLNVHMRSHFGEKKFSCNRCERKFWTDSSLKRHGLIHEDIYNYTCGICEKQFKLKSCIRSHVWIHFPDRKKPFACHLCSARRYTKGMLKSHLSTHRIERPYKCSQCSKNYQRPGCLVRHVRNAHKKS